MEISELKETVKKRLSFIESRLYWEGAVSRGDLVEFFEISEPQATNDLSMYSKLAPANLEYNKSLKRYEQSDDFSPIFKKQTSEDYFTRLLISRKKQRNHLFYCGTIPPFSVVPTITRKIDDQILRKVLISIHDKKALKIQYQSMTNPEPQIRWITPHAIGFDNLRWHIRALCHNHKSYRDFALPRFLKVIDEKTHNFNHLNDFEWHQTINLSIAADENLELGKRAGIELDYGMNNGKLEVEISAAFFFYFNAQYEVIKETNENSEKRIKRRKYLVLKNKYDVELQIKMLADMSKSKIKELFEFKPND